MLPPEFCSKVTRSLSNDFSPKRVWSSPLLLIPGFRLTSRRKFFYGSSKCFFDESFFFPLTISSSKKGIFLQGPRHRIGMTLAKRSVSSVQIFPPFHVARHRGDVVISRTDIVTKIPLKYHPPFPWNCKFVRFFSMTRGLFPVLVF